MKILAFSTSSDDLSICLYEDGQIILEYDGDAGKKHSETLLPSTDRLLSASGWDISDIDLFACDIGPGSFTGIRIAVATTNAFGISLDKPVAGRSSLDIIASDIWEKYDMTICMIYARNDQIYGAVYIEKEQIGDYFAGSVDDFLDDCKKIVSGSAVFTGDGSIHFSEKIKTTFGESTEIADENSCSIKAGSLAKLVKDNNLNKDSLVPIYLKNTSAKAKKSD